jgi:hypothetical protein
VSARELPSKLSPAGTAENAPGHGPELPAPSHELSILETEYPGLHPGAFSAVPTGLLGGTCQPRTHVLGYSQPSLRDSGWPVRYRPVSWWAEGRHMPTQDSRPGLLSAVPAGLRLAVRYRPVSWWAEGRHTPTQDSRPGLLSAVPTGLGLAVRYWPVPLCAAAVVWPLVSANA